VFGPDTKDEDISRHLGPLLATADLSDHVVVIAYGRSGSGKSKTIRGLL
jgi:hypothetical protein